MADIIDCERLGMRRCRLRSFQRCLTASCSVLSYNTMANHCDVLRNVWRQTSARRPNVIVDARVPPTESPAAEAKIETTPQRYVLPKNLRNAVKHLSDGELDLMHAATFEEMKRRGRTPKSVETDLAARPGLTKIQSPPTKMAKLNAAEVLLTRGQVNAVRSAFKVGITPSRIAREFGISQSDVRKALASDETKR